MLSLADRLTVPQVFFNDTHIGGADDTIAVLEKWDAEKKYSTPLERYQQEIESLDGCPQDPRLAIPTTPPVKESPPPPREAKDNFLQLPHSQKTVSVLDMTKELLQHMPASDLIWRTTIYKNCFVGSDGVTALLNMYKLPNREDALQLGRTLQRKQLLHHVATNNHILDDSDQFYFRLQAHQYPHILNTFVVWTERVDTNVMALLSRLGKILGSIESAVTNSDGLVDYIAAEHDEHYRVFEEAVCELQGIASLASMDTNTKLAFGINLYNLMIKHAFIKVGTASYSLDRTAFFNTVSYNVGGDILTLSELENGVLRGNSKAPYQLYPPFGKKDSRVRLAIPLPVDPRIHFALNCGAKSCPPVKTFTSQSIEEELLIVALAFCEQEENVGVDEKKHELALSMIFKWYLADFASSVSQLPQVVLAFLRGEKKNKLQRMINAKIVVAVKYNTYDWGTKAEKSKSFSSGKLVANESSVRSVLSALGVSK